LVCDEVRVINSGVIDLPNVVIDKTRSVVQICGSSKWKGIVNLPGLFASIMSHESLHLALLRIHGEASEPLDNVGSVSSMSRSLSSIGSCERYKHGLIGFD